MIFVSIVTSLILMYCSVIYYKWSFQKLLRNQGSNPANFNRTLSTSQPEIYCMYDHSHRPIIQIQNLEKGQNCEILQYNKNYQCKFQNAGDSNQIQNIKCLPYQGQEQDKQLFNENSSNKPDNLNSQKNRLNSASDGKLTNDTQPLNRGTNS